MSVEFVEPDPVGPSAPAGPGASGNAGRSWSGRLGGLAALVAAVLTGVAVTQPLYVVRRTAFIIDFDGTTARTARIPVDAFGDARQIPFVFVADSPPGVGSTSRDTVLTVTAPDSISYGRWWIGLAAALLVVAVWGLVRARSRRPAVLLTALGAVLAGSIGTAWLAIRTVSGSSAPQISLVAEPAAGLWLLVAGAAVALLAGLLGTLRPRTPSWWRRRRAARASGDAAASAEVRIPGVEPG